MSINPTAIVSLVTVLLAGCNGSSADIDKVLNQLTGKVDQQSQDLAATRVHTDAELSALRQQFASLALSSSQPSTEALEALLEEDTPKVQEAVPEPSMASSEASSEPVINEADLPCQEFEGVFRVWHCEDGRRMYP